ncbi:hypothetical protein HPC49_38880 [Pyxidicoccus fallax]|uniref:Lipoprotein n=1 Tax=Pyxidicoccus fallax TaxID=394095 RepID=A0A848LF54_9BACT|nr:hypothetical protein [Pyxidicoccus fallax]NMO16922.1 hypothetical protein [Pyxidicoccus fallax]NPC84164.1 hypothetical protein [Pyxidicoccus fallax]
MNWKMTGRLLAAGLLSMAAGCQGEEGQSETVEAQEAAVAQCVQRFDGITSCATGAARLTPTDSGLKVDGLISSRTDGVASTFSRATSWSQDTQVLFGASGSLALAARSGSQVVSTLSVTPGAAAGSVQVQPSFTGAPGGSAYRMNVYNDGVLQGGSTNPAARMIIFRDWYDLLRWVAMHADFFEIDIWYRKQDVAVPMAPNNVGACGWRLSTEGETFTVQLDDGRVLTGDKVEFIEEIEDGHYPYNGFTGIDVKAAAQGFNITGESVVAAQK